MEVSILHTPYYCNEIGRRENNEDSIYPRPGLVSEESRLFLVCDGMGGHEKGEVASAVTSEAIAHYWIINAEQDDTMDKLLASIGSAIEKMSQLDTDTGSENEMGTTLALLSIGRDSVFAAHVGDSRIYQFRRGKGIIYKSKDHSLIQRWVDAGLLTEQEARKHPKKNVITQAILSASVEKLKPEVVILNDLNDGDCFLLCSDGITESWTDEALSELFDADGGMEYNMRQIVETCREHSSDNFSAYLVQIHVKEESDDSRLRKELARKYLSAEDLQDIHRAQVEREVEKAVSGTAEQNEQSKEQERFSNLKVLLDKCLHIINQLIKRKGQ